MARTNISTNVAFSVHVAFIFFSAVENYDFTKATVSPSDTSTVEATAASYGCPKASLEAATMAVAPITMTLMTGHAVAIMDDCIS